MNVVDTLTNSVFKYKFGLRAYLKLAQNCKTWDLKDSFMAKKLKHDINKSYLGIYDY